MVSKKTVKNDTKPAEVKRPVVNKAVIKPAEKTAVVTKAAPKAGVKKSTAKKPATTSVAPVTANKDVVGSVLEIKAKNDSRKAKKVAPVKAETTKTAAVKQPVAKTTATIEKGTKISSSKVKRDAVKEKAQKAEAQKFIALKEETALEKSCCKSCCCCACLAGLAQVFKAWFRGYKNIFNYKGRTSRYDYWAFMLINVILAAGVMIAYQVYNLTALIGRVEFSMTIVYGYLAFLIVEILVYLSLTVRRLHDTGVSGWKGFYRPMTYTALGLIVVGALIGVFYGDTENVAAESSWGENLLGLGTIILLLMNAYYLFKTFIAAGFVEEEKNENAYGVPTFADDCCKAKVLRFASLYFVIISIYMMTIIPIVITSTLSSY